jgi:hypothetical protein
MALFARRTIQQRLDFLRSTVLTPKQAERLVRQLNSASRHVIPTEWELSVVAAFAKHSPVQYEPSLGRGYPDLVVADTANDSDVMFIAEITAVSDHGIDEANPADFLYEEILMMAIKLEIDFSVLGWHVGDTMEGTYPDKRMKVLLPPKQKIQPLLQTSIKPFLLRVRAEPSTPHELVWQSTGVDFRLFHDPMQVQSCFGGPCLPTVAYSKIRNPLYSALKKKAERLSKTKYSGTRGIIVGDGGCYTLRRTAGGAGSYSTRDIIEAFFATHRSVKFVTTSRYEYQSGYADRGHHLRHTVFFQRGLSDDFKHRLHLLLDNAFGEIPKPIASPDNASRDALQRKELSRGSDLGGYEWSPPRKLRIPVRVFLGLVGRSLTEHEFRLLFYQAMPPPGGPLVAFFRAVLTLRLSIAAVSIEACPNADNDWITFETRTDGSDSDSPQGTDASHVCELDLLALVRYFAGLDSGMVCGRPHYSTMDTLPDAQIQLVRDMLSDGCLLTSAKLLANARTLRLGFGDRDVAISRYV